MPSKKILCCALVGATLTMSGCETLFGRDGYFRDRGDDYLKAEPIAPVVLPSGVKSESIGQLFVIPPIADPNAPMPEEFEVPKPADAGAVAAQRNEVKIQKLGERSWISVNAAPSAVWPRLRAFLSERGLNLSVMDPAMGILETDWLSIKEDPSSKDRYRLRLEQGLRSNTTEVHVLQMTVSQAVPGNGQINWPAQSVNPQREAWMVNELAAHLARESTAQASMLAQAIGSSDRKVELVSAEGSEPYLALHLDYARAWASVAAAANQQGFHVENSTREQGSMAVSYSAARARQEAAEQTADAEKPGIFKRIGRAFGFGGKEKIDDMENLQLLLGEQADSVQVQVRAADGKPLDHREADRLLRLIRANLP